MSTKSVFTTLFVIVPSPNHAFPKGGKPSSVGKYFSTSGRMNWQMLHQSFAANHLHNTLGMVLPNIFDERKRITQTVMIFLYGFNFSNSSMLFVPSYI
jgi:hypothetical protein